MSDDFIRRYCLKSAGCTDAEIDDFDEKALPTMFVDAWADYESKKQKDAERIAKEICKIQSAANDAKPQTLDGPIALKQQDADREQALTERIATRVVTGVVAEVLKLQKESTEREQKEALEQLRATESEATPETPKVDDPKPDLHDQIWDFIFYASADGDDIYRLGEALRGGPANYWEVCDVLTPGETKKKVLTARFHSVAHRLNGMLKKAGLDIHVQRFGKNQAIVSEGPKVPRPGKKSPETTGLDNSVRGL